MTLRPYQEEAVNKMVWALTLPGNSVLCLPTGAGKTLVIAAFTARLDKPLLILVPSKELLEQDLEKLSQVVDPSEIGVYSASMNSKEVKKYTLATIQSAHKHPEQFAHYDVVVIDECDLLNPKNLEGMYVSFFNKIGNPKVFGLTATPWRQDVNYIYPPGYKGEAWKRKYITAVTTTKMINRMRPMFWSQMLYVINTQDLLDKGYLCPIEYHDVSVVKHEELATNKSESEFDLEAFDAVIRYRYGHIASYLLKLEHRSKLVFCSTIQQANELQTLLPSSVVVTSETKAKDRSKAVEGFRNGSIPIILNVGIYTVGFDYPELDCVILLRPTRSLRLHCQILGRITRLAPGKSLGHVYDLVNNIKSMGELADIRIVKVYDEKSGKPQWNVVSSAYQNGFHNAPLYSHKLLRKSKPNEPTGSI